MLHGGYQSLPNRRGAILATEDRYGCDPLRSHRISESLLRRLLCCRNPGFQELRLDRNYHSSGAFRETVPCFEIGLAGFRTGMKADNETRHTVMGALGVGAQFGVLLPFSREHESEPDYMGLIYVARACFDPTEAPRLWERMGQASSGRAPAEFMSTHPSHETRIQQFKEWMPKALEIRRQKCGQ